MHIPIIFEPWPDWVYLPNGPTPELTYQLTTGANLANVHQLATFSTAPLAGDEIGLKVPGLAGVAVYEVLGVQRAMGHAVVDTIYLQYLRQDV